jgi:Na+-driven multidrug efflux pump
LTFFSKKKKKIDISLLMERVRPFSLLQMNFNSSAYQLLAAVGGFLLGRTLAVLTTMTLGTSMAARQGPVAMAAHQICIQVWLAVSLLTDALAASGQVLNSFFKRFLICCHNILIYLFPCYHHPFNFYLVGMISSAD